MNTHARTKQNIERLKSKSFFKTITETIEQVYLSININKFNKECKGFIGSGCSGKSKPKPCSINYLIIEVKSGNGKFTRRYIKMFNKPVLVGKLFNLNGRWYRVIKSTKRNKYEYY